MKLTERRRIRDKHYPRKMGLCMAISIIFFILLFRFWPDFSTEEELLFQSFMPVEEVLLDEIVQTRQGVEVPPPPPINIPPIPVPDDIIIDEEFDFDDIFELENPDAFGLPDADMDEQQLIMNPQLPATVSRIVEPVVPASFREQEIRAQIVITFVVNQRGEVEEASINEIRRFDKGQNAFVRVDFIGFGIEDATVQAALRWRFRPAMDQGENVRTLARHTFNFGS